MHIDVYMFMTRIMPIRIYLCGAKRFAVIFPGAVVAEGRFPRRRVPKTDLAGPRARAAESKQRTTSTRKTDAAFSGAAASARPGAAPGFNNAQRSPENGPGAAGGGLREPGSRVSAGARVANNE